MEFRSLSHALETVLPESEWATTRRANSYETLLEFRCSANGEVVISDSLIEDAVNHSVLLFDIAVELFNKGHRSLPRVEAAPHAVCSHCSSVVPLPAFHKMEPQLELRYCEEMMLWWSQRALLLEKAMAAGHRTVVLAPPQLGL